MPQVFISYSRKDIEFVERLVSDLNSAGLTVWYDLSGFLRGILLNKTSFHVISHMEAQDFWNGFISDCEAG